jgi:fermentation-respiration switch protein FrsA (DUF1100 family)
MALNNTHIWEQLAAQVIARPGRPPRADWASLKAAYTYEVGAPAAVREAPLPDADYRLARLTFASAAGHSLAGLMLRPVAPGPAPCALLLHALSSDKETMTRLIGRPLAARGIASLALDAHLHGERAADRHQPLDLPEYFDLARESVVEYRQALDLLAARPDVDPRRIGLVGYSLGAMMGAILAGVDERVRACVLMVGGDMVRDNLQHLPPPLRPLAEPVCAANFVPHISPRPVLFINGKWDTIVPCSAATLLHEAAREPKEVLWADAGHLLPDEVGIHGLEWLAGQLVRA